MSRPIFDGAELTIYTADGKNLSIPLDTAELVVMLKAIGFQMDDDEYSYFGTETLMRILAGEINPFRLKDS